MCVGTLFGPMVRCSFEWIFRDRFSFWSIWYRYIHTFSHLITWTTTSRKKKLTSDLNINNHHFFQERDVSNEKAEQKQRERQMENKAKKRHIQNIWISLHENIFWSTGQSPVVIAHNLRAHSVDFSVFFSFIHRCFFFSSLNLTWI